MQEKKTSMRICTFFSILPSHAVNIDELFTIVFI